MTCSSANLFGIVHTDLALGVHEVCVFHRWSTRNSAQEELHV
jgi:hypothetical protein